MYRPALRAIDILVAVLALIFTLSGVWQTDPILQSRLYGTATTLFITAAVIAFISTGSDHDCNDNCDHKCGCHLPND